MAERSRRLDQRRQGDWTLAANGNEPCGETVSGCRPVKGFSGATTSVYPQTILQTCIVHLIRNKLAFVSFKGRKPILPGIKAIYRAENADTARVRLEEFEAE